LQLERQLAHLVEEQRAPVGLLEQPRLGGAGAGSLSIRFSGSAPQSTATNIPPERDELECRARAASSLPVPLSPSTSTVESVSATRSRMANTWRMALLCPSRSPNLVFRLSGISTSSREVEKRSRLWPASICAERGRNTPSTR
jgi:hypothetical protein